MVPPGDERERSHGHGPSGTVGAYCPAHPFIDPNPGSAVGASRRGHGAPRMEPGFAGRLAEPFILALLAREPTHGYGLLQKLGDAFGDDTVAKARVYQILGRMQDDGLIAEAGKEGNRKLYSLTTAGELMLDGFAEQNDTFYELLADVLPDLGGPAAKTSPSLATPPASRGHCPACAQLRLRMERSAGDATLHIEIARPGDGFEAAKQDAGQGPGLGLGDGHAPDCAIGEAVRTLMWRMMS